MSAVRHLSLNRRLGRSGGGRRRRRRRRREKTVPGHTAQASWRRLATIIVIVMKPCGAAVTTTAAAHTAVGRILPGPIAGAGTAERITVVVHRRGGRRRAGGGTMRSQPTGFGQGGSSRRTGVGPLLVGAAQTDAAGQR
jgi:hypothetical protein